MKQRVIIIGSGLGGLLCGNLLSREGFQVTVLEKHRKPGGCLQNFRRDIFTFDTGMHYLPAMAPGQPLHRYWKYFGLTDHLDLLPMDEDGFDRICFTSPGQPGDFMEFPFARGFDNFRERLLQWFPDAGQAMKQYTGQLQNIADSHPLYNLEMPASGASKGAYSDPYQRILAADWLNQLGDFRLRDVLTGNGFLYAWNPRTTPLNQFGLINHAFISSACRVAGGSQQIADILVEGIKANGGEVLLKKRVTSIRKKGETFGIETADGDHFESGMVISNLHPAATLHLIDDIPVPKAYRERLFSLTNTISVFSIYLGLKPGVFPYLNYNLYCPSPKGEGKSPNSPSPTLPNWGGSFPSLLGEGPGVGYVFMTPPERGQGEFARTAVIMAPMAFERVRRWEESASGARDKSYFVFKARESKKLLDQVYLRFPELKNAIATIDISTPLTWRDYTGTPEGSMYGVVKDAGSPEKTTILPRTKIPGLYFTGQNINLHGALGVTVGAVMTCGEILGLGHVLQEIKRAG